MKKYLYLFLSGFLGLMISLVVYIFLEIAIIYLSINVFKDFLKINYGFFLNLEFISFTFLCLVGFIFGIYFGKKWWKYIYADKKYKRNFFKF